MGGVGALLLLILFGIIFIRRRRRRDLRNKDVIDSSPIDTTFMYSQPPGIGPDDTMRAHPFQSTPAHLYTGLSGVPQQQQQPQPLVEPSWAGSSPRVLSYAGDSSVAGGSSLLSEQALLLHQLEGRQQRLDYLESPSVKGDAPGSVSEGPSASSAEVEELRNEVERLRKLLTDTGAAPPRYEE